MYDSIVHNTVVKRIGLMHEQQIPEEIKMSNELNVKYITTSILLICRRVKNSILLK